MSNCTSEDAQKNKEEMVQIHEWVEDFYKNMIKEKGIIKKTNYPKERIPMTKRKLKNYSSPRVTLTRGTSISAVCANPVISHGIM